MRTECFPNSDSLFAATTFEKKTYDESARDVFHVENDSSIEYF